MMTRKRRINPRLAKIHRNYRLDEVAELFGVHKNTVRQWIRDGLEVCDNKRPVLILGSVLREFLEQRNKKRKSKCKFYELYCVSCRSPKLPAGNHVEYNSDTGQLISSCPSCGNQTYKFSNWAGYLKIQKYLAEEPEAYKQEGTSPLKLLLVKPATTTIKYNPENERIKHDYLEFIEESEGKDQSTTDGIARALSRYEIYTGHKNFKTFNKNQAIGFKKHLAKQTSKITGKKLAIATQNQLLRNLKSFFEWLAMQRGYKSHVNFSEARYLRMSAKDNSIATAKREKRFPTIEQIKYVIRNMSSGTVIEKRNRAIIAFTLLACPRVDATRTFKLKHIDIENGKVFQDARQVNTKFRKSFETQFVPVGDEILEIFQEWYKYLKFELNYSDEDPLFPMTNQINIKTKGFEVSGLKKEHWASVSSVRKIFKDSFMEVGLPYYNPHSFRDTLISYGKKVCKNYEEIIELSKNIGHTDLRTTIDHYGEANSNERAKIINNIGQPSEKIESDVDEKKMKLFQKFLEDYENCK